MESQGLNENPVQISNPYDLLIDDQKVKTFLIDLANLSLLSIEISVELGYKILESMGVDKDTIHRLYSVFFYIKLKNDELGNDLLVEKINNNLHKAVENAGILAINKGEIPYDDLEEFEKASDISLKLVKHEGKMLELNSLLQELFYTNSISNTPEAKNDFENLSAIGALYVQLITIINNFGDAIEEAIEEKENEEVDYKSKFVDFIFKIEELLNHPAFEGIDLNKVETAISKFFETITQEVKDKEFKVDIHEWDTVVFIKNPQTHFEITAKPDGLSTTESEKEALAALNCSSIDSLIKILENLNDENQILELFGEKVSNPIAKNLNIGDTVVPAFATKIYNLVLMRKQLGSTINLKRMIDCEIKNYRHNIKEFLDGRLKSPNAIISNWKVEKTNTEIN